MKGHLTWRELYRCDELSRAGAVATSIAAMEFDVRVRDAGTGRYLDHPEAPDETRRGPFTVETRPDDFDDLADVLDEIIAEQGEFDAHLVRRERTVGRVHRTLLLVLIVVVGVLATLRLVDL